jgi:hypothetical protein
MTQLLLGIRTRLPPAVDWLGIDISRPRRLWALGAFVLVCLVVVVLEAKFHVSRHAYWIDHGLFGLGFPFALFAALGSWRLAFGLTAAWSLGNELWEDQLTRATFSVDWDHLAADLAGVILAYLLVRWLNTRPAAGRN